MLTETTGDGLTLTETTGEGLTLTETTGEGLTVTEGSGVGPPPVARPAQYVSRKRIARTINATATVLEE